MIASKHVFYVLAAFLLNNKLQVGSIDLSRKEIQEYEELEEIRHQVEICAEIKQCYCIKGTVCGWCESPEHPQFERALVGSGSGPLNTTCPRWITRPINCVDLICDTKMSHFSRILRFFAVPLVVGCIWLCVSFKAGVDEFSKYGQSQSTEPPTEEQVVEMTALDKKSDDRGGRAQSLLGSFKNTQVKSEIEILKPLRTYEAFRKGSEASSSERLPSGFSKPYNYKLETLKAVKKKERYCFPIIPIVFSKDMIVGASLFHSVSLMLMCACTIALLRISAGYMERDHYVFMCNILNEIEIQVEDLQGMVTLLLSFYALGRIAYWWSVQSEGFTVQGQCHNVAMIAGTKRLKTEKDWKEAYRLYRWLISCFYLAYQNLVPRLKDKGLPELEACGLLTAEECECLAKAHRQPITMLEAWIAGWLNENLEHSARLEGLRSMQNLRGAMANVTDLLDQRAPVSFESLLFMTTYSLCILLPFGPMHFNLSDREYVMMNYHIAPVVGVFLKSTFYLALLRLLRKLQLPFGKYVLETEDDLYPEDIMLSTEKKLRDYLTCSKPENE